MKKLSALLLALVLAVSMMSTAMAAYTPVQPEANKPVIPHTLTLTNVDMTKLDYEITYSFAVSEKADVVQPSDISNESLAVTGAPVIAPVTYTPADTFDAINRSCTKNLQIDWSGVSIKEPGVYRWTVNKNWSDTDPNVDPTNGSSVFYLYVYATDNAGTLTIESIGFTSAVDLNDSTAKGPLTDSYPAQTLDLSISKTVSGDQGSKDQYFKFSVTLTSPVGAPTKTYTIYGHDVDVPATAYHEGKTNVTSITVNGGKSNTVDLWLKHDQTVTIEDLIFGTGYSIVESANEGYTVTSAITGDTTGTSTDGATAGDTSIEASSTVAYNNHKQATVPTGIELHSGAPVMGLLMAAAMMLMLFIGKRKEAAE